MSLDRYVEKIISLVKERGKLLSRIEIAKELGVSDAKAREIFYIVRYTLQKEKHIPEEPEINPVDIIDIPSQPAYVKERQPYQIKGDRRIGVLCDIHFPFHDYNALKTALKSLYAYEVDTIILNGDIVDFYSVSFWLKEPELRNLQRERELCVRALDKIRKIFPDAEIIYKEGNHEERLQKFLARKAPELYDIEELKVENFLKLRDMGIKYVGDKRRIQAGELDIIHGHEVRSFASVNIALSFLRKNFRNTLFGHFHRRQDEVKKDIRDELHGAWAVGCLCNLQPDYSPYNEWAHGFAFVELQANGYFSVQNHVIQNGEVF